MAPKMDYTVKPAILNNNDFDAEERRAQLKKWIIVGVGSFVVVLLVSLAIYFATRSTDPVPGTLSRVPGGTGGAGVIENPGSIHTTPSANVTVVTPGQSGTTAVATGGISGTGPLGSIGSVNATPLTRLKIVLIKNWRIIVPIAVVIVVLLIAGITAIVMVTEQNRLAAEEALELARQKQMEEEARWWRDNVSEEKSGMSLFDIIIIVASVHVGLCLLTASILKLFFQVGGGNVLAILVLMLITGHSYMFILMALYIVLEFIVLKSPDDNGLLWKLLAIILLPVYSVLAVVGTPFMLLFCEGLGLLGEGRLTGEVFTLIPKVIKKIFLGLEF